MGVRETEFTQLLIRPQPDQEGPKLGSMSGTRAISTTSRRVLSSIPYHLKGKVPKEIHAIMTETLACFLPGRAKDLSAPLYIGIVQEFCESRHSQQRIFMNNETSGLVKRRKYLNLLGYRQLLYKHCAFYRKPKYCALL